MRNAPQINAFNYLYNTVIQNQGQTEKEVVQISQKRTIKYFSKLDSSVRSQINLLSEASLSMTTSSVLSALMRQLNSLNVIFPQ